VERTPLLKINCAHIAVSGAAEAHFPRGTSGFRAAHAPQDRDDLLFREP